MKMKYSIILSNEQRKPFSGFFAASLANQNMFRALNGLERLGRCLLALIGRLMAEFMLWSVPLRPAGRLLSSPGVNGLTGVNWLFNQSTCGLVATSCPPEAFTDRSMPLLICSFLRGYWIVNDLWGVDTM